jgi:hypothetical protein
MACWRAGDMKLRAAGVIGGGRAGDVGGARGIERDGRGGAIGMEIRVDQRALRGDFGDHDARLIGRFCRPGNPRPSCIHRHVGVPGGVDGDADGAIGLCPPERWKRAAWRRWGRTWHESVVAAVGCSESVCQRKIRRYRPSGDPHVAGTIQRDAGGEVGEDAAEIGGPDHFAVRSELGDEGVAVWPKVVWYAPAVTGKSFE